MYGDLLPEYNDFEIKILVGELYAYSVNEFHLINLTEF